MGFLRGVGYVIVALFAIAFFTLIGGIVTALSYLGSFVVLGVGVCVLIAALVHERFEKK